MGGIVVLIRPMLRFISNMVVEQINGRIFASMNAFASTLPQLRSGSREIGATRIRGVQYAQYQVSHFAQLRELFKTVWGAKRSEEYDPKYWNETLLGECPAVLGLWGKQVVGAYMIWPMQFSDRRHQVLAASPSAASLIRSSRGRVCC